MKAKKTQSTRKHGLSRLEKLLQASIRQELQIKALRRDLCALSVRIGQIEHCPAIESDIPGPWSSDSSEVWPWKPPSVYGGGNGPLPTGTHVVGPEGSYIVGGGGSGLDRNKP